MTAIVKNNEESLEKPTHPGGPWYNRAMNTQTITQAITLVKFTFHSGEVRLIPQAAVKTYTKKDQAVARMMELGGTSAPLTLETDNLMRTIRNCNKKIKREGWFSVEAKV